MTDQIISLPVTPLLIEMKKELVYSFCAVDSICVWAYYASVEMLTLRAF